MITKYCEYLLFMRKSLIKLVNTDILRKMSGVTNINILQWACNIHDTDSQSRTVLGKYVQFMEGIAINHIIQELKSTEGMGL